MRYFKNLANGGMVRAANMPTEGLWREATEREYNVYRARIDRMMGKLQKAVTWKASLLGVDA